MNLENLFQKEAFKDMSEERKKIFLNMNKEMKNKSSGEVFQIFQHYQKNMPNCLPMNNKEYENILYAILEDMDEKNRQKFLHLWDMMKNLQSSCHTQKIP